MAWMIGEPIGLATQIGSLRERAKARVALRDGLLE